MILSNIRYRTLFIKSSDHGTAFTIPVGTKKYLGKVSTTRHPVRRRDADVRSSVDWLAAAHFQRG